MTSQTIYQPIVPTYLYIKQHSITGMKYFGKTSKVDPYKYNGSGKYWKRHIKKYGKEYIETLWISEPYFNTSISEFALNFSIEYNIIESKEWANLKLENGLDGGSFGPLSEETKAKISMVKKGKKQPNVSKAKKGKKTGPCTEERKVNISNALKGIPKPEGFGAKISVALMGKIQSIESNAKRSATMTGKKRSPHLEETKNKISASKKGISNGPRSEESKAKQSASTKGILKIKFLSIIETKKTYDKPNLSKYYPEFKMYY
jgi:hypothetical protein